MASHEKAVQDIKSKVNSSRALFISHVEAFQNVVRLHGANSDSALEEISSKASSNLHSLEEFLAAESAEEKSIFDDLYGCLSSHQVEMAHFARELRQRFNNGVKQLSDISESIHGFLDKLVEESKGLERHASQNDDIQTKCIIEFQKAYEEQTISDGEKLIADMTSLVSNHMSSQKQLVEARLADLRETVTGNKTYLDGHISSMEGITTEAKRKWQDYFVQAESDVKDNDDFSAAKHCRMETFLQKSVSTSEAALKRHEKACKTVNEMCNEDVSQIASLVRIACGSNEQHLAEIGSAREAAEEDIVRNSDNIVQAFDDMSEHERRVVGEISTVSRSHVGTLESFQNGHSLQTATVEEKTQDTFEQRYMDYEATGTTPVRCEQDVPSTGTIEALRSMPMDTLQEEFRENYPYESPQGKELKPSLIPRSPFSQVN